MRRAYPHAAVQTEAALYQVVDASGQVFGPVDVPTLRQWAAENRLTSDMMVLDDTGAQISPLDFLPPAPVADVDVPGYQPQVEAPKSPRRATQRQKLAAFLVDFTIAFALFNAIEFMGGMLFLRINGSVNWHIWAYTRYLYPMLFAAYMMGRDALFPGQSVGKRIANIKVLGRSSHPAEFADSLRRNIVWAPVLLLPFRFGPTLGLPLLLIGLVAEVALTVTTGKGVGDRFGGTKLVQN